MEEAIPSKVENILRLLYSLQYHFFVNATNSQVMRQFKLIHAQLLLKALFNCSRRGHEQIKSKYLPN